MARGGGLITRDDLARYQAKWRDPIGITYRGHTIYTMPPPSGGGVTLAEILNVMEGYAPLPPFGSARLMHLQTEAMRRAYVDRNAFPGDPDFEKGVAIHVRATHRLGLRSEEHTSDFQPQS